MRHVSLTCVNHPDLRWSCKEIAVNSIGQYNGCRSIFYCGTVKDNDNEELPQNAECGCSADLLRFSPEELERQKTEPLTEGY
jgi:hypothetical protein